jgi:hypothetical protein
MAGFNSSIVLSALQTYVDQLSYDRIMYEITLQGRTGKLVQNQRGIKNARTINTQISNLVIQPAGCGLISPTGSVTLNQATLQVCPLMVQESICLVGAGSLEQYWLGMKMPEGSYYDSLTPEIFAKAYMADKVSKLQDINEFLVWQGSTTGATFSGSLPTQPNNYAANANQCNGFLQYLTQTSASQSVVFYSGTATGPLVASSTQTTLPANSAFSVIDQLVAQMPQNLWDRNDIYCFMSYANYRTYCRDLRNANLYHFGAMENADTIGWTIMHPSTNVRIVATSGLVGSNYIVLTIGENLYIGTDAEGEEDKFEIWKSQDYNTIFFRSMWKIGVTVAYPQYVTIYTGK